MQWEVFDWNVKALRFYDGIGGKCTREWLKIEMNRTALTAFASDIKKIEMSVDKGLCTCNGYYNTVKSVHTIRLYFISRRTDTPSCRRVLSVSETESELN